MLERSRRDNNGLWFACNDATTCISYVQRTVWDGDQVLVEERSSGVEAVTGGAPNYGTVRYVHALGLDAPVAVLDNRFSDARVLHYNWRGLAEASSWTTGSPADNQLPGGPSTVIAWPAGEGVYFKRAMDPYAGMTRTWIGSLPSNGRDGSGMLYRRNRYYDPSSGRFTQEDPIGIAGGMNQYGFASGDPVNFSDPFGLCPTKRRCRRYTFAHLATIDVVPGDVVGEGDQLGLSGNTGRSTGPHLHYEIGNVDESGNYTADMNASPATDGCPLSTCENVKSTPAGNRCTTVGGDTECRAHSGTDIAVPRLTRVGAPAGGEVIRAGYQNEGNRRQGFGLRVTVDRVIHKEKKRQETK